MYILTAAVQSGAACFALIWIVSWAWLGTRNGTWPIFLHVIPWFEYFCTKHPDLNISARQKNSCGNRDSYMTRNIHLWGQQLSYPSYPLIVFSVTSTSNSIYWFTLTQLILDLRTFVYKFGCSQISALGGRAFGPNSSGRGHKSISYNCVGGV